MRLRNKIALITGGGQGIGLAIAKHFMRQGAVVFTIDKMTDHIGHEREKGDLSVYPICNLKGDVTDQASLNKALQAVPDQIDILVNNAGINHHPASLVDTSVAEWNKVIASNLTSVYQVSHAVIPRMRTGGCILNIGSILGFRTARSCAAYMSSKGGILALTRSMAMDCAPGLRVNCIAPGAVETSMLSDYLSRCANPEAERKRVLSGIPLDRFGEPEDIANAAVFLVSDEAAWITGTTLVIDGGDSL